VTVADGCQKAIAEKIGNHPSARSAVFDITSVQERQKLVKAADIVVSLMPPHLHILLAKDCLQFGKNLVTSSYISPEMKALDQPARNAGLMFMCEMGLDPGIDHMTANQIIHSIQRVAGRLESFSSYCGGLIAPESDTNPWHYKFSWNPKNIIDAGKAGAAFLRDGSVHNVAYADMFRKNGTIEVAGNGTLAWYPNRDSLKYLDVYDVPDATTFLRATLRHPDFCLGWHSLVTLGLTDTQSGPGGEAQRYADWLAGVTNHADKSIPLRQHVGNLLNTRNKEKVLKMMDWLGLFGDDALPANRGTHGDILLQLLEEKWVMQPEDRDMVVMQHEVGYTHRWRPTTLISSMVIKGDNRELSAMAKTVGLPMGILTRMVLQKRLRVPVGVLLPGMPSVYRPVLTELAHYGIEFKETLL
jgi:saccharopine dehydrogenase (NADP+, L-glutamate forming)